MAEDLDDKRVPIRWPWKRKPGPDGFKVRWFLLAVGFLTVATAAILEHPSVDKITPDVAATFHSVVFSWKALIGLLKEIGFALIIAWAVSYGIERTAKKREHEAHEHARKQMASDVVHAVFGLLHSPSYVRTVVETTLQCRIVRLHYNVSYLIEPLSDKDVANLRVTPGRFVKLSQVSSYTFKNVSGAPIKHAVRYALPVRASPKLYEFAGITKIKIGDKTIAGPDVAKGLVSGREELFKAYSWDKTIEPGGELPVVVEAISLKELSDTEVWGSYHATYEGMVMSVRCAVPEIVRFGIRNLTASPTTKVYENAGQNAEWKIEGSILPNDSVVFWWRSAEDDGAPATRGIEPGSRSPRPNLG